MTRTLSVESRLSLAAALLFALVALGCGKGGDEAKKTETAAADKAADPAAATPPAKPADAPKLPEVSASELAEKVGVEPGGVVRAGGPLAVVAEAEGSVEIRKLGEPAFVAISAQQPLFAGDQIRTQGEASAKVVFVDETTLELPADSAIAIGDRDAQAAPASSAAVLEGAARLTVSPRAPGEGAFLVFTPGAIAAVNADAVLAVGVAANGVGRVGVETGEVRVAGVENLGTPATVAAGFAVDIAADGALAAPVKFDGGGWAEWRVEAEASADPLALAEAHAAALKNVNAELDAGFEGLTALTDATLEGEASVEASASANDLPAYQAAVPELGGEIEASYLTTLRLEQLSFAAVGRAYAVEELYVTHPDVVAPVFASAQVDVAGALLYSKKLHVVVGQRIAPLRASWCIHHPEGRLHAQALGVAVPAFYAKAKLKAVPAALVKGHLDGRVAFDPPGAVVRGKVARKVYVGLPDASWKGRAKVNVAPAKVAWHGKARGKLLVGVAPKLPSVSIFAAGKAVPLAAASVRVKGKVMVPTLKARAELKGRVGADVGAGVKAAHGVKVGVGAKVNGVKAEAHGAKVRAGAAVGKIKSGVKAGLDVKIKAPPPPKVEIKGKAEIKAKGGFKIGN